MKKQQVFYLSFFLFVYLLLKSCAQSGFITGGLKDTLPPVIKKLIPSNRTLFFDHQKIIVYFDENVKLEKAREKILISPKLINGRLSFTQKTPNQIHIGLTGALASDTTYSLLLNEAIKDLNENNPLNPFLYVFSTSGKIDSLGLKGKVNIESNKELEKVLVCLYTQTEKVEIEKKVPNLYTFADKTTGDYNFSHRKYGIYTIVAFFDKNKNYKFDNDLEKIDFITHQAINQSNTPAISNLYLGQTYGNSIKLLSARGSLEEGIEIYLNKEIKDISSFKLWLNGKHIDNLKEDFAYEILFHRTNQDKIKLWAKENIRDSLKVIVQERQFKDTLHIASRKSTQDSILLKIVKDSKALKKSLLKRKEAIILKTNFPLKTLDNTQIVVKENGEETANHNCTIQWPTSIACLGKWEDQASIEITFLPYSVIDWNENAIVESQTFIYNTLSADRYGSIEFQLEHSYKNVKKLLFNLVGKSKKEVFHATVSDQNKLFFLNIPSGTYKLEMILDENLNGIRDKADIKNYLRPEKFWIYSKEITLKPKWDLVENLSIPILK